MRWTTEAYYKKMTDVDPYDIDNVRIRYFGENNAKAYAAGIEMRLFGRAGKRCGKLDKSRYHENGRKY